MITIWKRSLRPGLIVSGMVVLSLAALSAQEQPTWKYHPPEWYRAVSSERKVTIARQRENLDLDQKRQWKTDVVETADTVTLVRQMHSMTLSKKTCAVTKVVIRQDKMAAADMCSLVITDQDGTKYYQRLATDGDLEVRKEKFYVYLDGNFTPRSEEGDTWPQKVAVSFKLYSSAGLLTVRCKLDGDPGSKQVQELKVINTLGPTPRPLDKVYTCYYKKLDGEVAHTSSGHYRVPFERDEVLFEGMIPACLWADGRMGFQVMPLAKTWYQTDIDADAPGDKLMTVKMQGGSRYINLTYVQKKVPIGLGSGQELEYSVALLPYRKFKPVFYRQWAWGSAPQVQDEHNFRAAAANGLDLIHNLQFYSDAAAKGFFGPVDDTPGGYLPMTTPKNVQRTIVNRSVAHKYGMKVGWGSVLSYLQVTPPYPQFPITEAVFTPEQIERLKRLSKTGMGSTNSPEYRDFMLDGLYVALRDLGAEVFYYDLGAPFYGETDGVWVSQLEGNIKWFEDVRLLLDAFGGGYFLYHSGVIVTPMEGMADTSFPGEGVLGYGSYGGKQTTGVSTEEFLSAQGFITQHTEYVANAIPPGLIDIGYNPVLIGTGVMHNNGYQLYRYDKPDLYRQCLALGSYPFYNNWRDWAAVKREKETSRKSFSPADTKMFRRYMFPLAIFNINDSVFHHPYDADYDEFAQVDNEDAFVNIYARPDELLVTAALQPWHKGSVTAKLDLARLGFKGAALAIYDVIRDKLIQAQENTGSLTIANVDLTAEGRIFYVKALYSATQPVSVWPSSNLKVLAENSTSDHLQMKVKVQISREEGTREQLVISCGDAGKPLEVTGARLEEYREADKAAVLVIELPPLEDVTGRAGKEPSVTVGW
jgi:hypothetical protein